MIESMNQLKVSFFTGDTHLERILDSEVGRKEVFGILNKMASNDLKELDVFTIKKIEEGFEKTEKDARARRQSYVRMQKSFDLEIQERKAAQQSEMEQK